MKLVETLRSKKDRTVKQVFLSQEDVLEFSYLNKGDGKDIVVVPTQTACNLGCKFCFLTGLDLPVRNLRPDEMIDGIKYSVITFHDDNEILLISFMGCGEPLLNPEKTAKTMSSLSSVYFCDDYNLIRFAVASLIPSRHSFIKFKDLIIKNNLHQLVKFHYSLHTTDLSLRKRLMPAAIPSTEGIELLKMYKDETKNDVEIHYSLMDLLNDTDQDAKDLSELLKGTGFNVKILKLSEKESVSLKNSHRVEEFRKILTDNGIENEYYEPPGSDVGASCGQFLLDFYKKYGRQS
jgi:23S rRNA (adenine2503-C2)-methyltransferase